MASAISALANASVVFTVPAGGTSTVTDAVTGNVTPATTTLTVSAYLKAESTRAINFTGVDVEEVEFEGYAVDPQVLDARVVSGTEGSLTFDGAEWEVEVVGVRQPYGATGLIGATLRSTLGDKLRLRARGQR